MKKFIEKIIFGSKWLLVPFYMVLILSLGIYTYFDIKEFGEYMFNLGHMDKEGAMLIFIQLIDITMIANLGKMIITGSYNSFISKEHGVEGENVSSGMLKVKMATSLVGVTGIGLLQKSIDINTIDWETLHKMVYIHGTFLVSALILELVDYLHCKTEKH